ncbi:MAG: CRTAC1 family protein [Kiritimatiellia bacterium]|jgi:hypothetical protein|nr:CRTAC1 family protein [Kiritimatiellia bacterium]
MKEPSNCTGSHAWRTNLTLCAVVLILACLCTGSNSGEPCTIHLRDVSRSCGIKFNHTHGGSGRLYVFEPMTAGLASFDYDNDGDIDLYFLNGAPLPGTKMSEPQGNALYRNEGNCTFTDVTDKAGVGDQGYGLGVAVADYDNDGDQDIYLNNYGPNRLYRNNGNGTFSDVTARAGLTNGNRVGAGTNFLDMDGDGDLDLFVANYLQFSFDAHKVRKKAGHNIYPGPRDYPPARNNLYRNNNDGTFSEVSTGARISGYPGTAMGTVCADYDNDGDTDVYVANDDEANFLFRNDGSGTFVDAGLESGVAHDLSGGEQSSMGVACGDYDNDGWLDFYVTGYQQELALLYKNLGDGFFEDTTRVSGAGSGTFQHVNWGTEFVDFDNDGDKDLFVACGHFEKDIRKFDDSTSYQVRNVLLMNTGAGKFVNVSSRCGDGLAVASSSRGTAFDDLDNDGDIDIVVLNWQQTPTVLRNDSTNKNHWIQIRLSGTKTNRDGIGARVKVVAGDLIQIDEVHSGRGYQSHYGTRLHFGLGKHDRIDRIEISWIGGGKDVLENIRTDQLVIIMEGSSEPAGGSQ